MQINKQLTAILLWVRIMIHLEHISKTYTRKKEIIKAVDDVSIDIKEGEIFGIIGFSGAGKSTLVRCINLLEYPDAGGKVTVDGVELTSLNSKELRRQRSNIGMIFQHFNLMPSRTVLENVLYPLAYKGIKKGEQIKKATELLKLVDLSDRIDNYPSQLSGGQKQRVAIARALALDPKVLLCDEATSALDPQTTYEIIELLKKLNEKLKLTIVVITHEMDVVKDLCSKVAVMEKGKVVEQGEIFNVFSNPKSDVTTRFMKATSNLSKAEILIKRYKDFLNLHNGDVLARLSYIGKGVSEPIISSLTEKFHVAINIILADVALLHGNPIGGTVCIFSGDKEAIENALASFDKDNVKVEVLSHE